MIPTVQRVGKHGSNLVPSGVSPPNKTLFIAMHAACTKPVAIASDETLITNKNRIGSGVRPEDGFGGSGS